MSEPRWMSPGFSMQPVVNHYPRDRYAARKVAGVSPGKGAKSDKPSKVEITPRAGLPRLF